MVDAGREEDEGNPLSGRPCGELQNTSHDTCRGSLSQFIFFSLTDTSSPVTRMKRQPEETTKRVDMDQLQCDDKDRRK